jgi:hypothetical protein
VVRGSTWYLRNTLDGGQADVTFADGYPGAGSTGVRKELGEPF